jgi:hypothetical protein
MIQYARFISLFLLVAATGCSTVSKPESQSVTAKTLPACYVIIDAGSSGTRLFIYEKHGTAFIEHEGPKVSALADPIRENRGKKHSDIDAVTTEVASTLDDIKVDGPLGKKDKPKWKAFDWTTACRVESAVVYGTAGMRIAEQNNPEKSIELWSLLNKKLKAKTGDSAEVVTKTITGAEEGIFTWLTVRDQKKSNSFGVVGMGGASAQVTFPCSKCDPNDDALIPVKINDETLKIYSFSFLGLGQNEAPKSLGVPKSCAWGIGTTNPDWKIKDCAKKITLANQQGIIDPLNFYGKTRGAYRKIPTEKADVSAWLLTEKFADQDKGVTDKCCVKKGKCELKENSCFVPIYFEKYLQALNVSDSSEKIDSSWTIGAAICKEENCMQLAKKQVCRWLPNGCLQQP